ncbi:MAG: hypothetical protein HQL01_03210 [Nitrospirae bacterium]|nr:hypothetical protein [Nitrospirota bacterium]
MGEDKDVQTDLASFIDFIKSSFNATLDNIYEIQELSEKVLAEIAKNEKIIHEGAEQTLQNFLNTSKKSREEFKSVMENGFRQLEGILRK